MKFYVFLFVINALLFICNQGCGVGKKMTDSDSCNFKANYFGPVQTLSQMQQ